MMDSYIDVLVVDDEPEACINLQNILKTYIDEPVRVIGVAHNTREAEALLRKVKPAALFLDIEMPNENAFGFLTRIAPFDFEVIFVTAYDHYAVRAFKLNAVDYILKPISISELGNAVQKLKERLRFKNLIAQNVISYADLAGQVSNKVQSQKITLKNGVEIEIVEFKDILFVEAQGSYIRVLFHKGGVEKDITISTSLSDYEELLPASIFYRVHKSYLINCMHVTRILKEDTTQVIIAREHALPVSRRKSSALLDFLKTNNYAYE